MTEDLSRALDDCLALMWRGAGIETCMTRYPHLWGQLEPLLETAIEVSTSPKIAPTGEYRRTSRARLLSRIREEAVHGREERTGRVARPMGGFGAVLGTLAEAILPSRGLSVPMASALLVALAVLLVVYSVFSFLPGDTTLGSQCTVSVLSGHVEFQSPGSDIWTDADDGMTLEAGARVKTAADSNAMLTFFEGSSVKLEPGTDVQVERIVREEGKSTEIVLKQWLGRTWNRVVKKADPGSRYEIQTPSAYALVRGTLFGVNVDEDGSMSVRTFEGLVSVGAQGQEVDVSAGQTTSADVGVPPAQPSPMPAADSQLMITVSMPAVASVSDPTWSSTGYLPTGLGFNQIAGSQSTSPVEGDQVITIEGPVAGLYNIILRGVGDGVTTVTVEGLSGGETVFRQEGSYDISTGGKWLLGIRTELDDGLISSVSVGDLLPLGDWAPENVVTTELQETSLEPIKPSQGGEDPIIVKPTYELIVTGAVGGVVTVPGEGTFTYDADTVVEIVAVAEEGYEFVDWIGGADNPLSPRTTVTMSQDHQVAAKFGKRVHVLTIISRGGGTVSQPGESISMHRTGAVVVLVAEPGLGWEFDSWTGDVADPQSPVTTVTMTHPETITANFVPKQ
jgi:hypothetical protein